MSSSPSPAAPEEMSDAELVEAVAREVMGWTHSVLGGWWRGGEVLATDSWNPLTDWNDTMEVVMKLTDHDTWAFSLESYFPKWLASFDHMESDKEVLTKESDPQRAICIAALKAVRSSPSPNA